MKYYLNGMIEKGRKFRRFFCLIIIMFIAFGFINLLDAQSVLASNGPIIFWASAKAGQNNGWEGSSTKGAAITIWGTDFGSSRGSNCVTCASVSLTNDTDYAEWGATTNPNVPPMKGFSRITFWLNSNMQEGNEDGITVTINGITSNTKSFKIDNTGEILFMSPSGSGTKDGSTKANALDGSQGDFQTNIRNLRKGDFLYLVAGSYVPDAYMGYMCARSCDATAANRITITNYPTEEVIIDSNAKGSTAYIKLEDDYITIANLEWNGGWLWLGAQSDACTNYMCVAEGLWAIGNEWYWPGTGADKCINSAGDDHIIAANYFHYGEADASTYVLYVYEGDDRIIADNYIRGGNNWMIHLYDEERCIGGVSWDRVHRRNIVERNIFDLSYNPQLDVYNAAMVIGTTVSCSTTNNENTIIRNNVFFSDGSSSIFRGCIEIIACVTDIKIYNNTFWNIDPTGSASIVGTIVTNAPYTGTDNIYVKNNIFSGISGYHINNRNNINNFTVDNNFYDETPSLNNCSDSNAKTTGNADFISTTQGSEDFHLRSSSGAIDVGATLGDVTEDFDGISRYRYSGYDTGAYEYLVTPPSNLRIK